MSFGACGASHGRLDAMPLGQGGAEGYANPVGPRYDKAAEANRPPIPPVPRTMRAKAKASSRGYMARANRREDPHVELRDRSVTPISQCSETRRPREESPFAYARKGLLQQERNDKENQAFEMGPTRRNAEERNDYRLYARAGSCPPPRKLADGGDGELPIGRPLRRAAPCGELGMPGELGKPCQDSEDPMKKHLRRRTLQRERVAADQGVEWAPECAPTSLPIGVDLAPAELPSHARRRLLARENHVADKASQLHAADGAETFGRIMGRRDGSAPPAVRGGHGADPGLLADDVVWHGRKNLLAHGTAAHEGQSFSRIMGR